MDELFRFVVLRPPEQGDAIVLTDDSASTPLSSTWTMRATPTAAMQSVAGTFMHSQEFVSDPSALSTPLVAVADTLEQTTAKSRDALEKAVAYAPDSSPRPWRSRTGSAPTGIVSPTACSRLKVAGPDGVDADAILRDDARRRRRRAARGRRHRARRVGRGKASDAASGRAAGPICSTCP